MKLIRHSFYNIMGLGLPLLVAVFSIPVLIRALGEARFGLLTLIWAVVSYFGLFDLGLGRALTQKLAVEFSAENHSRVGSLVATSLVLMAVLGIFAGTLMAALAEWGVGLIKDIPNQQEAIKAVYWMAAAMPSIVLTSGLRGILEARQAFAIVNLIRLPMGLFTFLGPLLVVYFGEIQLDVIAFVLSVGRGVACLVHGWYAWRQLPLDRGGLTVQRMMIKPLCISGGWMTVSNVVGPLMGYLDRFVVGALASSLAVAYYATPQELISKLSILPSALMSVVFPQFSKLSVDLNKETTELIANITSVTIFLCLPAFCFISFFSFEILALWIGNDFSNKAAGVLSLMACGMLINSISFVPLTWLQAADRSKKVAAIHLLELPVFCAMLWFGIHKFGIMGAAVAWVLRIVFDACLLWLILALQDCKFTGVAKKYLFQSIVISSFIYIVSLIGFSIVFRSIIVFVVVSYCFFNLIGMFRSRD